MQVGSYGRYAYLQLLLIEVWTHQLGCWVPSAAECLMSFCEPHVPKLNGRSLNGSSIPATRHECNINTDRSFKPFMETVLQAFHVLRVESSPCRITKTNVTLCLAVKISCFSMQCCSIHMSFQCSSVGTWRRALLNSHTRRAASEHRSMTHLALALALALAFGLRLGLGFCQRHADLRLALPLPSLPSPYADRRGLRRSTLCHRQRRRRSLRRLFLDALLWLTQFLVPSQ